MGRLTASSSTDAAREAGDLCPMEAIDREGLLVTSEGALVRFLRDAPQNPLVMSPVEREQIGRAFADGQHVRVQGVAQREEVTGRQLVLFVVIDEQRKPLAVSGRGASGGPHSVRLCSRSRARSRWAGARTRSRTIVQPPAASGSAREGVTQKQPRDDEVPEDDHGEQGEGRRGDQWRASNTEAIVQCRDDNPVGLVAKPQRGGRCLGDRTSAWPAAVRTFPVMVIPIVTEQPLVLEPTTRDDFLGSQSAPRPAPGSRVTADGSRR